MKRLDNKGMGHVLVLVATIVIVGVAFVGWHISQVNTAGTDSASVTKSKIPKTIKNTADLQKASNALDTTAIDKSLDTTSLDSAVNNLL